MPTAAKLVAAILLGVMGWFVADMIVPYFPEEMKPGRFREIVAAMGVMVGWTFLGRRAGGGLSYSFGLGLAASGLMVFWSLFFLAGYEMVIRSLRKSYAGPMEGLKGMMEIAIEYLVFLKPLEVAGTLIIGGMILGFVVELVAKRYP
ncbi:TrgA family protein [Pseudoruegeria sp. HB172150]|uniref:TrgA family protein n=1 Tax=Pseudoruegeria sp. HB172150 TaxID=2721164 RepID=UPI001555BC8A|nr:TrgA family protein [Pseudoruegeria sp. HB172150]